MISTPAKGESVALHVTPKDNNRIQVGMSWDTGQEKKTEGFFIFKKEKMVNVTYDCDLFCCIYDQAGELIDHVTPENANLMDSSEQIFHSGDNQTGRISGDDEYISINTANLPDNYYAIVFFAMAQGNRTFKQINNSEIRVADGPSDENQLHLNLDKMGEANTDGLIFAALIRDEQAEFGWKLKNISEFKNVADVEDWGAEGAAFIK